MECRCGLNTSHLIHTTPHGWICPGCGKLNDYDECQTFNSIYKDRTIDWDKYTLDAMRTNADCVSSIDNNLLKGILGLAGESGELIDYVKKVMFHDRPFDKEKIINEVGDVCWYLSLITKTLNVSLKEILDRNICKLKKRYPDGFSIEGDRNR